MVNIPKLTIDEIQEGLQINFQENISEDVVNQFAQVSGDFNTLHMKEDFAKERGFKGRVVHGGVLVGLLSRLVGMHLPGENALFQSMNIQFISPVYISDSIEVNGVVDQISRATKTIIIKATITRGENVVLRGKLQIGFTN